LRHLKPLNRKAKLMGKSSKQDDVYGMACSSCGVRFNPGWEIGYCGNVDPCPWISDLPACHYASCWWAGSVPGVNWWPNFMDCCGNLQQDWTCLCTVPDPGV